MKIQNLKTPIDFVINRDRNLNLKTPFETINATSLNSTPTTGNFLLYSLNITSVNVSLHVEIKPMNSSSSSSSSSSNKVPAYLVLLKFGDTPSESNYDIWKLFCPGRDLRQYTSPGVYYYMLFANKNQTNGRQGKVGLGFRELNETELETYCSSVALLSLNNMTKPPMLSNNLTFTYSFSLRAYSSGCYYIDSTGAWLSDGVEVLEDTNMDFTHCQSNHLTEYAGGFVTLPPQPDFNAAFVKASFTQNLTIYITVILLTCLYIVLAVLSRYWDYLDAKKLGITMLANPRHAHHYEIVVFTGSRFEAGTESKVHMILNGDESDSKIFNLQDDKRKVFQRGAVDTFLVSTPK